MSPGDRTLDPDGDLFLILTDQDEDHESDNTSMDDENDTIRREIRVRCSSKHLTLASSSFKAMLSRNFKESAVLRSTGTLNLPLPDDHAAALLILLDIIHGQTNRIPLEIDLSMLTQIAIVVDKYRLQMVVRILSRIWIDRLEAKVPRSWMEDSRRWMFISLVFQRPVVFKSVTRMAERQSESRIDESGEIDLPIPSSIADTIDQHRQRALLEIITLLHRFLKVYQGPGLICTTRCDALVLGSLTKSMNSMQVLIAPEAPYSKLSFDSLAHSVRAMVILTDNQCENINSRGACKNHYCLSIYPAPISTFKTTYDIHRSINKIEEGLCGLDLDIADSQRFDDYCSYE